MCLTPITVRKDHPDCAIVPCMKCPECRAQRASAWSFRLMQEEKFAASAYFITLTYDNDNIPFSQNGFMDLSKRHLQLFFKKLRKYQSGMSDSYLSARGLLGQSIKYYAVGEYGSRSRRPHYHVILFNADIELIEAAWTNDGVIKGHVHYGTVSGASVGYTMKYISKPWQKMHKNDDRQPQFALMSKGLGCSYLGKFEDVSCRKVKCVRKDTGKEYFVVRCKKELVVRSRSFQWHTMVVDRMYVNLIGGKKATMPRYFKLKIYEGEFAKQVSEHYKDRAFEEMSKRCIEDTPESVHNRKSSVKAAFRRQARKDKVIVNSQI